MEVIQLGRHWFLQIGRQRIEFTHDGRGVVRMAQASGSVDVIPRWAEDRSLCWGSVCVRGDLPLD
jgi:hypothetical protein